MSSYPHNKGVSKVKVGNVYSSVGGYGEFEVLEYVSCEDITIRFINTGYTYSATAGSIIKGLVKDYTVPTLHGVGYNSMGRLLFGEDVILKTAHNKWQHMISRCYSTKTKERNPTYVGCTVEESWHDFANFYEWFRKIDKIEDKLDFHLDKDILVSENKVYSKDTCCLLPRKINNIIFAPTLAKDSNTPAGVHFHKGSRRYQAYCNTFDGKRVSLGFHTTLSDAHKAYVNFKKDVLKECAEYYKDVISEKVYNRLLNYNFNTEGFYE